MLDDSERRLHASILVFSPGTPRFTSQPTAATVHQGSSHVMPCEVNADLVPFARWEKDRQALELGTRLIQLPSGALVISNASEGDAGLYRCLVENVGSSKSSDEAQLHIVPGKRKPNIKKGETFQIQSSTLLFRRSSLRPNHASIVEAELRFLFQRMKHSAD